MRLDDDRAVWLKLVRDARAGDAQAWSALVDRFENLAIATAVELCGDRDQARDIAQEAFAQAVRHLESLEDPQAFPAWLLTLVRTANNRRARRRALATESIEMADAAGSGLAAPGDGPGETVLAAWEAARIRNAIERLPDNERSVIALHYLAELPYADVAEFLGINVSAAKKRAWSARRRLKQLLPTAPDAMATASPSPAKTFRDTILVFQAIRTADADLLSRLLARDPGLASVSEDWSAEEGFEAGLSFSERATALVRAAGRGDVRLVQLLVEAGAEVDGVCGCVDRESPLAAAVNVGAIDVAEYLVERGASMDDAAFDGGSTALHIAVHKDTHRLERLLLDAGADPSLEDGHGRTAADWTAINTMRRHEPIVGDLLWTRIRAIDLFAPLHRGDLVYVPPAYGLGAMRTIYGIVDALEAHFWMIGFEHGPYINREFEQEVLESGTPATIDLVPNASRPGRRHQFVASLDRLSSDPASKVVLVVPAPGHEHDVTISLPRLAADPSILATFVVAPFRADPALPTSALPEGFDARIVFDPARAAVRSWPAIDPALTGVRTNPNPRHDRVASAARRTLATYGLLDPSFDLPDPARFDEPAFAQRAQRLHRYLSHAFRPFEHLAAEPAVDTTITQLLHDVGEILDL